jgi:hypothetical protein
VTSGVILKGIIDIIMDLGLSPWKEAATIHAVEQLFNNTKGISLPTPGHEVADWI